MVVNQDSFQHLPEYSDEPSIKRESVVPLRRASIAATHVNNSGRDVVVEGIPLAGDPNIVVLPRFEDMARRNTFSSSKDLRSPLSPFARHQFIKKEDSDEIAIVDEPMSMLEDGFDSQEEQYSQQFRHVVWKQLVPAELDQADGMMRSSVGLLETAARVFPPVFFHPQSLGGNFANIGLQLQHAMMAVAALSLAATDSTSRLDALQHYQQALPALQSVLKGPDDLSSDGAFLTHFLLLVYEVSAIGFGLEHRTDAQDRSPPQKPADPIYGLSTYRPSYGLPYFVAMFLAAKDTLLLFGGYVTLTWMHFSVELEEANLLDTCFNTTIFRDPAFIYTPWAWMDQALFTAENWSLYRVSCNSIMKSLYWLFGWPCSRANSAMTLHLRRPITYTGRKRSKFVKVEPLNSRSLCGNYGSTQRFQ